MEFTEFVAERERALLRFAMVLTGDARASEEIVADVLARAYERWDRIGGLERVRAYVRRMVVNEFLSRKRRQRRVLPMADLTEHAGVEPDPADGHADRDALRARLAALPRKQRAALALRYFEGLPDAEIATAMGSSVSAVRSNISRALATLRVELDPPPDRPPPVRRAAIEPIPTAKEF